MTSPLPKRMQTVAMSIWEDGGPHTGAAPSKRVFIVAEAFADNGTYKISQYLEPCSAGGPRKQTLALGFARDLNAALMELEKQEMHLQACIADAPRKRAIQKDQSFDPSCPHYSQIHPVMTQAFAQAAESSSAGPSSPSPIPETRMRTGYLHRPGMADVHVLAWRRNETLSWRLFGIRGHNLKSIDPSFGTENTLAALKLYEARLRGEAREAREAGSPDSRVAGDSGPEHYSWYLPPIAEQIATAPPFPDPAPVIRHVPSKPVSPSQ